MKKKIVSEMVALLASALLITVCTGCGRHQDPAELWQTASMGYLYDGTMQPEHYVQFTDSAILYGHLEDGRFVTDYSDQIVRLEKATTGSIKVQAVASNGVQYTYQTSESDNNVLDFFETWLEEEFPEMYRGGASLSRSAPLS